MSNGNCRAEARSKVVKYLGRYLITTSTMVIKYPEYKLTFDIDEQVHHINGNECDNRLENLYVFMNRAKHTDYHLELRNWSIGLCGLNRDEKIKYLDTFPELVSNLDEIKDISEVGMINYYDNLSKGGY